MKATKLPSGRYRVQVFVGYDENGQKIVKSFTATKKEDALLDAAQYKSRFGIGATGRDLTVAGAIHKYIESRTKVLSPTSIRSYRLIAATRLQSIMDIHIGDLKLADVQEAVNNDADRLSAKSLKEAVSLVNAAMMFQDVCILNLRKRIAFPPQRKKIKELPSFDEVIRFVIGTPYELPCLLAMWLSLRMAEVRGLKYSDITAVGSRLRVRRERVYFYGTDIIREMNKTYDSTRTVPLPRYLHDLIMKQEHKNDDEFIVNFGYNGLYKGFRKQMDKYGYTMNFHDLRHIFATTLNDIGVPSKYIQKLGGWSTDNVMKSVYTHTTSRNEKEFQSKIDELFDSELRKNT